MSEDARSAAARRAAITTQIQTETGIDETMIDRTRPRLLCAGPRRRCARADLRREDRRLGAASATDVRLLVLGRADERTLPRPADGQAPAIADRCLAFRSLAGAVRESRTGVVPAEGRGPFRDAGAPHRREPGGRRRRRARLAASQGRTLQGRLNAGLPLYRRSLARPSRLTVFFRPGSAQKKFVPPYQRVTMTQNNRVGVTRMLWRKMESCALKARLSQQ